MTCTFEEYLEDVKRQLCCNNSQDVEYITYDYTEEQVEENIEFFKDMWTSSISAYKALLFLSDYIKN